MSKPIARIVFAVLISLILIAAAAPIVGGVFRKEGVNASATTSMFTDNQTLRQETLREQIPAPSHFNDIAPSGPSHDCNSPDPSIDY